MQRVSLRTLALLLELLVAVAAFQYLAAQPVKADAVWLGGDCVIVTSPAAGQTGTAAVP
jgi:hypothetical protein